jgi:malate synthase
MSLDNQRNLKLAIHRDPVFLKVAEQVTSEMNTWAKSFFGRETIRRLAEAARLHHEDLPRPRPPP